MWPLACWDCGFESRRRHGCLSAVSVVCQVVFCASGGGGSYRLRCVAVCDVETSWMRRPWPELGHSATITKNMLLFHKEICWYVKCWQLDCCYNWILDAVFVLTLWSLLVTWCTNIITFNYCSLFTHGIYKFCIYLRTNSDLCHLQHKLFGFYNRDEKCLQRGTDWGFKQRGLRSVCKSLK